MATIRIRASSFSGVSGLTLWLYSAAGALVNTGGDALAEVADSDGLFEADVDEALSGDLDALIKSSGGVVLADNVLYDGQTTCGITTSFIQNAAVSAGGDPTSGNQQTIIDAIAAIAATIAGGTINVISPVAKGGKITMVVGETRDGTVREKITVNVGVDMTSGYTVSVILTDAKSPTTVVTTLSATAVSATAISIGYTNLAIEPGSYIYTIWGAKGGVYTPSNYGEALVKRLPGPPS